MAELYGINSPKLLDTGNWTERICGIVADRVKDDANADPISDTITTEAMVKYNFINLFVVLPPRRVRILPQVYAILDNLIVTILEIFIQYANHLGKFHPFYN